MVTIIHDNKHSSLRQADLFGVELHLALGLREKFNIICAVDLLSNYSNLVTNRELKIKKIKKQRKHENSTAV